MDTICLDIRGGGGRCALPITFLKKYLNVYLQNKMLISTSDSDSDSDSD